MRSNAAPPLPEAGFTLVEAILVIVITGVLFAIVGIFIVQPVQGYVAAVNRAELADSADNAIRQISRELRLSLPNSVRTNGQFLEFIPAPTGGRYYTVNTGMATAIDPNVTTTVFTVMGNDLNIQPGQNIVIGNLGEAVVGSNAYSDITQQASSNRRVITGLATPAGRPLGATQDVTLNSILPFSSANITPPFRFFVVNPPVLYACVGGNLIRYTGYGFLQNLPIAPPPAATAMAIVATNVTCGFAYSPNVSANSGLVTVNLQISRTQPGQATETVALYEEVRVDNAP